MRPRPPVPAERAEALARVGAIVEEPRFHLFMTGRENLEIVAAARDAAAFERIDGALERVGLAAARADERVKKYSLGMRQRLGVARALLGDPELLDPRRADERPRSGRDFEFRNLVRRLVGEGRTVVVLIASSRRGREDLRRRRDRRPRQRRVAGADRRDPGGGRTTLLVEVDDVPAALALLCEHAVEATADGLRVALPTTTLRTLWREINRLLVAAGLAVRRLEPSRASLEERFLEITSRLEEAA